MTVASVPKTVTTMLSCRSQYYKYGIHPAIFIFLALVRRVATVSVLVVGSSAIDKLILVAGAVVVAIAVALRGVGSMWSTG